MISCVDDQENLMVLSDEHLASDVDPAAKNDHDVSEDEFCFDGVSCIGNLTQANSSMI